jgi:hypothetical protein
MATSAAVKRLQKIADQIPDDAVVWDQLQHHDHDDDPWADHLIAIVAASYVEHALEVALVASMVKLSTSERDGLFTYERKGPLADFSSKIKLSRALGIIGPQTRADLDHVRNIRNAFAHTLQPIGFETAEVAEVCALLQAHDQLTILGRWTIGEDAKSRYINTTLSISRDLKAGLKERIVMQAGRAFPLKVLP